MTRVNRLIAFLGKEVSRYIFKAFIVGLILYVVELSFAFGIQALLFKLLGISGNGLPKWLPVEGLTGILVIIFLMGLFRCLLLWGQVYFQGAAQEEFMLLQRKRLIEWALREQSVSYGHVLGLFYERTNTSAGVVMSLVTCAVQLSLTILVGISLVSIAPIPTAISSLLLLVLIGPTYLLDKKIGVYGKSLKSDSDKTNRGLVVNLKNLLLMQIYGTVDQEEQKLFSSLNSFAKNTINYWNVSGLKFVLPQFAGIVLACGVAVSLAKTNQGGTGYVISYFYLFIRFVQGGSEISKTYSNFVFQWPRFHELASWWTNASKQMEQHKKVKTVAPSIVSAAEKPWGWSLTNVSYQYPSASEATLQGLSLQIPAGSTFVITGASGSGKSTLLGLLLGTNVPDHGELDIQFENGETKPLLSVRQGLFSKIGYVGPESFLIDGTVQENIFYGLKSPPSSEQLSQALIDSECQFIQQLPLGLNHKITDQGQGLSAGQKQRLSLARALIRNPSVLILDEATANLDDETEARLISSFRKFKGKMTIIIVTHRQAILSIADHHLKLG